MYLRFFQYNTAVRATCPRGNTAVPKIHGSTVAPEIRGNTAASQ